MLIFIIRGYESTIPFLHRTFSKVSRPRLIPAIQSQANVGELVERWKSQIYPICNLSQRHLLFRRCSIFESDFQCLVRAIGSRSQRRRLRFSSFSEELCFGGDYFGRLNGKSRIEISFYIYFLFTSLAVPIRNLIYSAI